MYLSYRLPKTLTRSLARKFALINVQAIRSLPERVLPSAAEYLKTTEEWCADLQEPRHSFFVCVAANAITGATSLEEGRWVGLSALCGPLSIDEYCSRIPGFDGIMSESHETRWHAERLFVAEGDRNFHAFSSLNQIVLEFMEQVTRRVLTTQPGLACSSTVLTSRLQSWVIEGSTTFEANLANGGNVLAKLTWVQFWDIAGKLCNIPNAMLLEEHSTKPVVASVELISEVH